MFQIIQILFKNRFWDSRYLNYHIYIYIKFNTDNI